METIVLKGMIKVVPLEKHYFEYEKGVFDMDNIQLEDTLKTLEIDNKQIEVLNFKLTYLESSSKDVGFVKKNFKTTSELTAMGKEMRILLELGKYAPVKVVCNQSIKDGRKYNEVICVQSQAMGIEKPIENAHSNNIHTSRGIDV